MKILQYKSKEEFKVMRQRVFPRLSGFFLTERSSCHMSFDRVPVQAAQPSPLCGSVQLARSPVDIAALQGRGCLFGLQDAASCRTELIIIVIVLGFKGQGFSS